MDLDTNTMPISENDIINALDLDRDKIQYIDIHHDYGEGLVIELTLASSPTPCPICHTMTSKIKGYRTRNIQHSIFNSTPCTIRYNARRYVCPVCHKTFYESNHFTQKGTRLSVATVYNVLTALKVPTATFSEIGERYHISATSIANIFDNHVSISRRPLPECLSFDEVFAFQSDHSPCVCVLLDYNDKKIVDILPSRKKAYLIEYFSAIPLEERNRVKYVSFDMWEGYRSVSKLMFPKSKGVLDKFHVVAELRRNTDAVRLRIQNENYRLREKLRNKQKKLKESKADLTSEEKETLKIADENYYLLKKFSWVLFSNNKNITNPNIKKQLNRKLQRYLNLYDIYDLIIKISPELEAAIDLKDSVHRFYKTCTIDNAKSELEEIIQYFRVTPIPELYPFSNTLIRWKQEIINSFIPISSLGNRKLNNALIENRNKTIKAIKTSSNGYTCWHRFRNRVLYCLNDDETFKL